MIRNRLVSGIRDCIIISAFLATLPAPRTVFAADECATVIVKENAESSRTVFLAGGDADSLFIKYISALDNGKVKHSLWGLKVFVSDGKTKKEYSSNWISMLTGQSGKEYWAGQLKGVQAALDPSALSESYRQKWDIVCVGKNKDKGRTQDQTTDGVIPTLTEDSEMTPAEVPLDAKQHLDQGMQYAHASDWGNAVKEFDAAIAIHPSYAAAYMNRAVVNMQKKNYELAKDDLTKAAELAPKDPMIHYNMASLYTLTDKLDRALVSLDKALANGFAEYEALRKDPDLAKLRKHPEWQKTLERHKVFLK